MTVAWGFELGFFEGTLTPVQFANKASSRGYHWAALELDDFNNAERWGPFRHACHNAQPNPLRAGVWMTKGENVAWTPADANFTIAEVESEEDRLGALASAAAIPPGIPKWIITNFTPLTDGQGVPLPEKAQPLIDAGYGCMVEAYEGDSPGMNADDMIHRATVQLGWPIAYPIFGVHNKPILEYADDIARYPRNGFYLAEYLL